MQNLPRSTLTFIRTYGHLCWDGLLRHIVQISPQQLGTFDVISPIQFFVDRVCGIGRTAHGEEQHIFPGGLLEGQGNWNAVD